MMNRGSVFKVEDFYDKVEEEEERFSVAENPQFTASSVGLRRGSAASSSSSVFSGGTDNTSSQNHWSRRRIHSAEYDDALERLSTWTDPLDLAEIPLELVQHPEYLTPRMLSEEERSQSIYLRIRLPGESSDNLLTSMDVSSMFRIGDTPAKVIAYARSKFFSLGLDFEHLINPVIKVAGKSDYMLHVNVPLAFFDSIVHCHRLNEPLEVVIYSLPTSVYEVLRELVEQPEAGLWEDYYDRFPKDDIDLYSPIAGAEDESSSLAEGGEGEHEFHPLVVRDMGHSAFKAYIKTLQAVGSEGERRY